MAQPPIHSGSAGANQRVWNTKVASYLAALHAYQEWQSDIYKPACKAMDINLGTIASIDKRRALLEKYKIFELEKQGDQLGAEVIQMLMELVACPAPMLADLKTKLEICRSNEFVALHNAIELLDHMIADVKRLVELPS